jgi:hypothetical protein
MHMFNRLMFARTSFDGSRESSSLLGLQSTRGGLRHQVVATCVEGSPLFRKCFRQTLYDLRCSVITSFTSSPPAGFSGFLSLERLGPEASRKKVSGSARWPFEAPRYPFRRGSS